MHGDVVSLLKKFVQGDLLGRQVALDIDDVEIDHVHSQGQLPASHFTTDSAEADDAGGLAVELRSFEELLLPLVFLDALIGLGDEARRGEHEADGVLGHGDGGCGGGVENLDSQLFGLLHVDVVQTDTGADGHLEVLAGFEDVGLQLRGASDDDPFVMDDFSLELVRGHPGLDSDFESRDLFQLIHGVLGKFIADQNLCHFHSS